MTAEDEKAAALEKELQALYGESLGIYRSEPYFIEIVPRGVDKGQGFFVDRLPGAAGHNPGPIVGEQVSAVPFQLQLPEENKARKAVGLLTAFCLHMPVGEEPSAPSEASEPSWLPVSSDAPAASEDSPASPEASEPSSEPASSEEPSPSAAAEDSWAAASASACTFR